MPSIPIDVLREILEHVRRVDLPTLCRVNKIFCSYSQDLLYRDIKDGGTRVIHTLARSTDLARRVRSFAATYPFSELATALRNMSSLRWLRLWGIDDDSILDGCAFKLDTISCNFSNSKRLQQFMNSQPSLTNVTWFGDYEPIDERCLPNLTRVSGNPSFLSKLIPGRPVGDVTITQYIVRESFDFTFFTLSAAPIQKLYAHYYMLYPKPGSFLVSIFPSLVCLGVYVYLTDYEVRVHYICLFNRSVEQVKYFRIPLALKTILQTCSPPSFRSVFLYSIFIPSLMKRMNPHSSCEFPIELLTLNISRWIATAGSELVGSGLFAMRRNVLRSRFVREGRTLRVFL